MSKQEVDEKTPLLDEEKGLPKEEGEAKKEKSLGQKVWSHVHFTPGAILGDIAQAFDLAPGFGVNIELAVRAGVMASLFGGLLLDINLRKRPWHQFADMLEEVITPFTLIMFYFALAKTLGGTFYNIWCIVLGQGIATLAIWLFFGFFPGGTSPDAPAYFTTGGILAGSLVVIVTLYLNFDTNVKIFVLANWVFFWMDFMNDKANVHNQGFSTGDYAGPRATMFRQSLFACLCGLIVAVLPYPIWAQTKLTDTAKQVADELTTVWKAIATAYWSENPESTVYEFDALVHHVDTLAAAQGSLAQNMDESWWECFGFGPLNSTRFCCSTLMETLDHDLDRLHAVLAAIQKSQGQSSPEELADHERLGKIYAPCIFRLNEATCDLLQKSTDVAIKGGPTDIEKEELTKGIADVQQAIDALHDTVKSNRPNTGSAKMVLDLDYLDEYTYFFCQSHFGRSTTVFAKHLVDVQYESPGILDRIGFLFIPWNLFDKSELLDPEHLRFVARNSLAIILAFALGYLGFPIDLMKYVDDSAKDRPETAAQKAMPFASMLPIHAAGPAFILTLMVSKFAGSAIQNTLNRVMGTILGIIFAMMLIGVFGRNWKVLVLCLGVWTAYTVFMYMDCTVHAGTFLMMGYFGAGSMVRCVPASTCTFEDRKTRAIGLVIEGMFALVVMIIVDFIMAAPPASRQAAKKLEQCWSDLVAGTRQLLDDSPDTRKNKGVIREELSTCRTLALEASNEPRYWKNAWKGTLYDHIVKRNGDLRLYMVCMHYSVAAKGINGAPKADFFIKMVKDKEFKDIGEKLLERMEVLSKLLGIFEHEGQSRWGQLSDKGMFKNYMEEQRVLIGKFVEYVNHPEQAWLLEDKDDSGESSSDSLERDSLTKLSMLIHLIQSLMEDMRKVQHSILRE